MSNPEQENLERNVRRTSGIKALKDIRVIVEEDNKEEIARQKLLRIFLRYGWIVLLPALWLLMRYMNVR